LRGAPGVVVGNDLLVAPGHHVVGPPVEELGGVHDEEPRLALFGFGGEQDHGFSGLRLGGFLGGGQPFEFECVPVVVVGDHAVLGARDFGWHCAVPFPRRAGVTRIEGGRIEWFCHDASLHLMERIAGGSSGSIPSLVPVSTSPFSRVPTSSAHARDMAPATSASTTPIARNENRRSVPVPASARSKEATPTPTPMWNEPVSARCSSCAHPVT